MTIENEITHPATSKEVVEMHALSELIKGVVTPFSESQRFVAEETTKQTAMISDAKLKIFWGICFLVLLIIILAGYALHLGKDAITEKIIIAIVSFLGGFGFSKIGKNS